VTGRLRRGAMARGAAAATPLPRPRRRVRPYGYGVTCLHLGRLRRGGRSGLAVLRYGVLSGGSKHDVLISHNKESSDF
jgi:hypothetical protein